ncbi:hypothetical protein C9890_0360 [Perkinsus sp. BL_2016]|nr:hypothetical protein C9890_0360 [Perkinsus sp. BL_2016]
MMISDLKDSNWIDYLTAAVIIEITVYHASLNTFALDRVVFEFPQDGTMHASQQIESFQAFEVSFVGANASQMTLNVVNIIWQVVGIGSMVFAIWTLRGRFFFFFWNWYDLAMLGVAFVYMGHRISMLILSPSDSFGFPSFADAVSIVCERPQADALGSMETGKGTRVNIFVLFGTDVVFSNLSWAFTARALSLTNVVWTSGTSGMSALLNLGFILGFYFLVVPIMIATGIWGWLDINMGGPTDPKRKHPFSVLFELISNRLRRRSPVEAFDLLEREISLSQFPTIIADRIVRRRKAVCSRVVDVFGLFPSDYSEHRDTIHLTELQRILDDDSFTVKVLGSSDANQIAETLSAPDALVELQAGINRKIDVLQKTQLNLSLKFDPSIERLSIAVQSSSAKAPSIGIGGKRIIHH